MGRVVITHSTYIEGLIPVLKALAAQPGIDTITPAVICRVKGRSINCGFGSQQRSKGATSSSPAEVIQPRKCS